jgi:hypothetical protein
MKTADGQLWLDRYLHPLPIRSRGSFHVVAARLPSGAPRTVVVPGKGARPERVEQAFAEVEAAHARVSHPRIPPVTDRGRAGDVPFLELGCETAMDGADLLRLIGDAEQKIPYAAADGFIAGARMALEAAHAAAHPRSGAPLCIGRISYASFLFSPGGRWWLVGLGRNFPIERDTGAPDAWVASFHAPEMSSGSAPSPMGDYVALLLFMRSMLPFVDTHGTIGRLLRGEIGPADLELLERLRWFDQNVVGQIPSLRPPMAEAVAVSDRVRELLGVKLDLEGFDAFAGALIAGEEASLPLGGRLAAEDGAPPARRPRAVTVGPGAAWVAGQDGERRAIGHVQRRIVIALLDLHAASPGATLTMWEVFEAGWPGERPLATAASNRVYVTLARLRQAGLRDVIERSGDGYRIAPGAAVHRA